MSQPPTMLRERFPPDRYPLVDFGEHTYGDVFVAAWDQSTRLRVGKYCSFAFGCKVLLGGEHRVDWATTFPFSDRPEWPEGAGFKGHPATRGDVVIGNDVWLAAEATVLSGSTIGSGAVVCAQTLVTGFVAPYAVVGGNPMRLLRWRFPPELCERLLQIAWWDWPRERAVNALPLMLADKVENFVEAVERGDL